MRNKAWFLSLFFLLLPAIALAASNDNGSAAAALVALPFMIIWLVWTGCIFLFWLGMMAFAIGGMILWIFMLIDVTKREFKGKDEKLVWVLILVLTGVIGAIIYYFYGRKLGIIIPEINSSKK